MLEYMALWAMTFAVATSITNLRAFNKLIEKIKQTETARENMQKEERRCESMRLQYENARDAYDARLETLKNAEAIAAILAGKEAEK